MTNKTKSGMGYLLSVADYPDLFSRFRIVNEFQSKGEKKVILNYTEVERQGDTFQFISTNEDKAVIVYIPIANMPVELTNMLQGLLKDGKAVIPIYAVGMQHIFIGGDRLDGAVFPDRAEFVSEVKYLERTKIKIPAKTQEDVQEQEPERKNMRLIFDELIERKERVSLLKKTRDKTKVSLFIDQMQNLETYKRERDEYETLLYNTLIFFSQDVEAWIQQNPAPELVILHNKIVTDYETSDIDLMEFRQAYVALPTY
jgi:hypothetical protein